MEAEIVGLYLPNNHHDRTLRFARTQSLSMQDARWELRLSPLRPMWKDCLGAFLFGFSLMLVYVVIW